MRELEIVADRKKLRDVLEFLRQYMDETECPSDDRKMLEMATEEIFVNIASYAYQNGSDKMTFRVSTVSDPFSIELLFIDSGIPFDPLKKEDPDITLPAGERPIGGLGIFLVKKFMDEVEYVRENGCNVLRIRKMLHQSPKHTAEFRAYLDRISEIRFLSFPRINTLDDAGQYMEIIAANTARINVLSRENQIFLDETLYPMLEQKEPLPDEDIGDLLDFLENLIDAGNDTAFDYQLSMRIAEKLIRDADERGDVGLKIRVMDSEEMIYSFMLNVMLRVVTRPEWVKSCRDAGMKATGLFVDLVKKDRFSEIGDEEARERVLTDYRFYSDLYTGERGKPAKECLELLENALSIAEDTFYRELVPNFDWDYYLYRVLEYYALSTDQDNAAGYDSDDLERICEMTEKLWVLRNSKPKVFNRFSYEDAVHCLLLRNRFLAGRLDRDSYLRGLFELQQSNERGSGRMEYGYAFFLPILEYLCELEKGPITSEEEGNLKDIYENLLRFLIRMPAGTYMKLLDYLSMVMYHFIDIPAGMSFENLCLKSLAVMNPQIYVHSRMTGRLAETLAMHLILVEPDYFTGFLGCGDTAEVLRRSGEIREFVYRAALVHDIGKIPIADSLIPRGREPYDIESAVMREHVTLGEDLLRRHASTERYASVARWHHAWFAGNSDENSAGNGMETPPVDDISCITYIVTFADSLDHETDPVIAIREGDALEMFIENARQLSGRKYAPSLVRLMDREDVLRDIRFLLGDSRQREYRDTCQFINDLAVDRKKIERDLESARSIQLSAMPDCKADMGGSQAIDIYARMLPASQTGGDFYDFFYLDDDHFAILIADVSGKGIPAAMFMMRAKSTIKSLALSGVNISELFGKVNRLLCENNKAGMFVTVWFGVMDIRTGVMEYVNAGHTKPLFYHGGHWEFLKDDVDLVVGGLRRAEYHVNRREFCKDDIIVLYTDGVTEAQNARQTLFGEDRLFEVLRDIDDSGPKSICDTIYRNLGFFVGDSPQADDIAMLAMSFRGHIHTR